mmetsp:Transcript_41060/g.98299  ORF Transcript_41060/g.98299 Transcript_41060/m.98299 type:complete len:229 (-) Transcript_41060:2327-3013(-)
MTYRKSIRCPFAVSSNDKGNVSVEMIVHSNISRSILVPWSVHHSMFWDTARTPTVRCNMSVVVVVVVVVARPKTTSATIINPKQATRCQGITIQHNKLKTATITIENLGKTKEGEHCRNFDYILLHVSRFLFTPLHTLQRRNQSSELMLLDRISINFRQMTEEISSIMQIGLSTKAFIHGRSIIIVVSATISQKFICIKSTEPFMYLHVRLGQVEVRIVAKVPPALQH